MKIALLHPELGLGGAERLMVDAAVALQARGHAVTLFAAQHDRDRCFDETRDGTLDVRAHAGHLPLQIGGRLRAPVAIARMRAVVRAAQRAGPHDVVFCDTVPHVVPFARRHLRAPVAFYCHFPDQLLARARRGWYRWYRWPLDRWEENATASADRLLVNSEFTAAVVRATFRRRPPLPEVLHPGIDVARYASAAATTPAACTRILALSRFVPQKNLALAIDAFADLRARLPAAAFNATQLVIAGGYDARLAESRATAAALERHAEALGLRQQISFHYSPTDRERLDLFAQARCVVYTPSGEHFGYVPIEAMASARPVIAVADGGPAETVEDGVSGFLCPSTAAAFAQALQRLWTDPTEAERLGRAGHARVARHFSLAAFGARLEATLAALAARRASTDRPPTS
jgi:alpha-1,3/alpha-1,6-mannosyltransferase